MPKRLWSEDETVLALALYCKIPFGQIHKNNAMIIKIASLLHRTPAALSMKMCNFGRFDSELSKRGVSGLAHGSKVDQIVWEKYHCNMEALSNRLENFEGATDIIIHETVIPTGNEKQVVSKTRIHQDFFRSAVLSAYESTCCITGLNIASLLLAAHIKPWSLSNPNTERTNPQNGLCLNPLHHEAFDQGLITIDSSYKIVISQHAKECYSSEAFENLFLKYEGKSIILPKRFMPSQEMIEYHNDVIFDKY